MATAEKRWFEMAAVNWGTSLLPDLPRNAATARRVCTVGDLVRSSLIPAVIWARINEEYFTECPVTPRKNRYFGTGLTSIWRERSLPKTMNSRAVSCQLLSITLRLGKVTRYLQIRYSWQLCKRETGLALQCDILIKSAEFRAIATATYAVRRKWRRKRISVVLFRTPSSTNTSASINGNRTEERASKLGTKSPLAWKHQTHTKTYSSAD